jgi:uncharacterized protein YozE (UPF0346 family)
MTFFQWLITQRDRHDDLGRFAVLASADKSFPKKSRQLGVFLQYYEDSLELRRVMKWAHREWRKTQRKG